MTPNPTGTRVACELSQRGRRIKLAIVVQKAPRPQNVKVALGHTEPPPVVSPPPPDWLVKLRSLDPLCCWLVLEAVLLLGVAVALARSQSTLVPPPLLPPPPPLRSPLAWASTWLCSPAGPPPSPPIPEIALAHALCAAYVCIAGLLCSTAAHGSSASQGAAACALLLWNALAIVDGPTTPRAKLHALLLLGTAASALRRSSSSARAIVGAVSNPSPWGSGDYVAMDPRK